MSAATLPHRHAWIEAAGGVSGDMLLGALVGLGLPTSFFEQIGLDLGLPQVKVAARQVWRCGITAWSVVVEAPDPQPARHLAEILARIEACPLPERARAQALRTFELLAAAEAEVHGAAPEELHFHEVGAVDALVDIVGFCAGVQALGITSLTASPLPVSTGTVTFSHGTHGLPAPAVGVLLAGVPVRPSPSPHETITPTGLALLKATCSGFGPMPEMRVETHGRGAGQRDSGPQGVANLLRIFVGQPVVERQISERCAVITANVDDGTPQQLAFAIDALLSAGADDAWITPIVMKKGRPAHQIAALCGPARQAAVVQAMLVHTPTVGCRIETADKRALPRVTVLAQTPWGQVPVKRSGPIGGRLRHKAEHDACAALARSLGLPVDEVAREAERVAAGMEIEPEQ